MISSKENAAPTTLARSLLASGRRALLALGLLCAGAASGCAVDATEDLNPEELAAASPVAEAELALSTPSASMLAILNEREGWGKHATGGKDGNVYHVTTRADSGPGSLRAALESPEPLWIVFDVDGDIVLSKYILVKSNKTVDARGRSIQISTDSWQDTAFKISGSSNIILINLEFDNEYEDYTADEPNDEGGDAIEMDDAEDIWIHHCGFDQWADGAVDIRSDDGPSIRVSVTWSRFRKIYQALGWNGVNLSLGHNVAILDVGTRFPKISGGSAHSYNNYISDWANRNIQYANGGGQLFAQRNIYEAGDETDINSCDNGDIEVANNHLLGGATFRVDECEGTVDPEFKKASRYRANVEVCDAGDNACWGALKSRLLYGDATHAAAGANL